MLLPSASQIQTDIETKSQFRHDVNVSLWSSRLHQFQIFSFSWRVEVVEGSIIFDLIYKQLN